MSSLFGIRPGVTVKRGGFRNERARGKYSDPNVPMATVYLIGDTHYGTDNLEVGDANLRQIAAIKALAGTTHPLGGTIKHPNAVIQLGDAVHEEYEDTVSLQRFWDDYRLDGSGTIPYPCYVIDGNHDRNKVRTGIIARHGSKTWGVKIGSAYFQAMTENYTGPSNTTPPTSGQISADIAVKLNARPAEEPKFLLVHRALTPGGGGGYVAEWDAAALTTLDAVCSTYGVVGILFGHNHYSIHDTWTHTTNAVRMFSPGSVTQSPVDQSMPYTVTYPESFAVLRVGSGWYDVASYCFGFDVNRAWAPGTWEWSERVHF